MTMTEPRQMRRRSGYYNLDNIGNLDNLRRQLKYKKTSTRTSFRCRIACVGFANFIVRSLYTCTMTMTEWHQTRRGSENIQVQHSKRRGMTIRFRMARTIFANFIVRSVFYMSGAVYIRGE